jgi:hypothetical protein
MTEKEMSYKIVKLEVYECKCEKCGHEWKAFKLPRACANCKQIGWTSKDKK